MLAAQLDAPARAPGREVDRLVRRLFDDGQAEAADELAAIVPGIVEGVVQLVAVVATGDGGGRAPVPARGVRRVGRAQPAACGPRPPTSAPARRARHALVVVHHRGAGCPLLAEIERAVAPCLTGGFTLGVSDPAPLGVRAAREARRQALAAAELAALDPALARPARWASLGAYRTLLATPRPSDRALRPLDEAGASAPMLLATLEAYLDLAGDVQAVANRLNLHRSSLYYRLDRIAQLAGVDLADGLVRLDLHLALKARRVRRRTLR